MPKRQSKIEKLIAELCPAGVEIKELGEVFDVKNGYTPSKSKSAYWENGTVPWFRMEDIRQNGCVLDDSLQHINKSAVKGDKLFPANSILVATSATIGEHALITVPHLSNQRFVSLSVKHRYKDEFITKFIHYYFYLLDSWCVKNVTKSSFASVDMSGFRKFQIPIPPRAIQQEIVKILDTFTTLEAELEAELEARKKQYEYYRRDLMLSNNDGDWKTLGDIYDFQYGEGNTIPNTGGKYPVYGGNRLAGQHDQYNSEDAPVIGHIGAYAGIVNWVNGKHFVTYNGVICKIKTNINPRYGYYLLLLQNFRSQAHAGSQPFISYDILKKATVQIPDLSHQNSIVTILDKFDALVNDISVGLPAELNARRKQYEYYRGKLLTFKEKYES